MTSMPAFDSMTLPKKLSPKMRAVLIIISANPTLIDDVLPYIDFKNEVIEWDQIFSKIAFADGHRAACFWAYSIHTNKVRSDLLFELSEQMDAELRSAVLRALRICWGVTR